MSPPSPPPSSGGAKPPLSIGGIILVVIGMIILLPCGLCTAGFLIQTFLELVQDGQFQDLGSSVGLILFVGGLPSAFGALLVFFGTRLRKSV